MPCPTPPGPRPSFIPVPDTCKAVMRYSVYGQIIENVHFFRKDGGYNGASLAELAADISGAWSDNLMILLPPDISLLDVTCTDQAIVSGEQAIQPVGLAGTSGSAAFPDPGATFAIKFGTGLSGRSYRGRMYWPLLQATAVSAGTVLAVAADNYTDAVREFFGDIRTAGDNHHVVVSYQNDCEWRTEGNANDVTSYSYTDRNLDSMRSRLPGRGI